MKALLSELRKTKSVWTCFLVFAGWVLSPLTFWNDAFVNIPIAYLCACVAALFSKQLFLPALLVSYWLTNLIGIIMMGHGIDRLIKNEKAGKHPIAISLVTTLIYTLVVLGLFYYGILKPIDISGLSRFLHQ